MKRGSFVLFVVFLFLLTSFNVNADLVDWFSRGYVTDGLFDNSLTGMPVGDPDYCQTDEGLNDYGNCPGEYCAAHPSEALCTAVAGRDGGVTTVAGGGQPDSGQVNDEGGDENGGAAPLAGSDFSGDQCDPSKLVVPSGVGPGLVQADAIVNAMDENGNTNGVIDGADFDAFKNAYCSGDLRFDYYPDGKIDRVDYQRIIDAWGQQTPKSVADKPGGGSAGGALPVATNVRAEFRDNQIIVTFQVLSGGEFSGQVVRRVDGNSITGFGVWDSIKGFFKRLFGQEARGTRAQAQLFFRVYRIALTDTTSVAVGWVDSGSCSGGSCTYIDTTFQSGVEYVYVIQTCRGQEDSLCDAGTNSQPSAQITPANNQNQPEGGAGGALKPGETQACTPKAALTGEALIKNADLAEPKGVIDHDDFFKMTELNFDVNNDGCVDSKDSDVYVANLGKAVPAPEGPAVLKADASVTVTTGVVGKQVILDGSKSTGPGADGKPLGYYWVAVGTPPETVSLSDGGTKAVVSFTPQTPGDYTFTLTVTGSQVTQRNEARVTIKVAAAGGGQPGGLVTYTEAMVKKADFVNTRGVAAKDGKITQEDFFGFANVYGKVPEGDINGDGKSDMTDNDIITKMLADGASYTLSPVQVGIDAAGSKLSSIVKYEGANVGVKLTWEAVKLQEGGNLVSASVVYDNRISSYGVLDSIGNFFTRLFGGEARGARLETGGRVIEKEVYYRIERVPGFSDGKPIVRSETQAGCEDNACEYVDAGIAVGTSYTYKIKACLDAEGKTQCTAAYFGQTTITPRLPDFDNNGCVDVCDLGVLAKAFNSNVGEGAYDARVDLDLDNAVRVEDFLVIAGLYGGQAACQSEQVKKTVPKLENGKIEGKDWMEAAPAHPACQKAVAGGIPGQPAYDASCLNPVMLKEKGKRSDEAGSRPNGPSGKAACEGSANKFCTKLQIWGGNLQGWKDVTVADMNNQQPCEVDSSFAFDFAYVACCSAIANKAPNVVVTKQLAGAVGGQILLDGSGSTDPESGKTGLRYFWEQVSTPPGSTTYVPEKIVLTGANTAQARFTPGKVGIYTFKLSVTDDKGASASDTVSVNIGGLPDFDGSGCVDYCDYLVVDRAVGKKSGELGFLELADVDKDGEIKLTDGVRLLTDHFKKQGAACTTADPRVPGAAPLTGFDASCDLKQLITAGNTLEVLIGADKLATFKWKKIATKTKEIGLEDGITYVLLWKAPGQTQETMQVVPPGSYTCTNGICQFKQVGKTFEGSYQYRYGLKACLDKEGKTCTAELASVELTSEGQLPADRIEAVHEVPGIFYGYSDEQVLTVSVTKNLDLVDKDKVKFFFLNENGYKQNNAYNDRVFTQDATGSFNYNLGKSQPDNIYYYIEVRKKDGSVGKMFGNAISPNVVKIIPAGYDRRFDVKFDGCVDKQDESTYAALLLPTQTDESKKIDFNGDGKKDEADKKFFAFYLKSHKVNTAQDKVCKCTAAGQCFDSGAADANACIGENTLTADNKKICSVAQKAKECTAGDDYEIRIGGSSYCCSNGGWVAGKCTAAPNPAAKLVKQEQGLKGVAGKNKLKFDRTSFEIELGLKAGSEGGITTVLYDKSAQPAEKKPEETGVTKKAVKYVQVLAEDDRLEKGDAGLFDAVNITFTYTDGEIAALGLSEPSLQIYWFNTATKKWDGLSSKVDVGSNTVNATLNHLSIFGLFGDQTSVPGTIPPTPTTQPSPTATQTGGPGGGGAGGGGKGGVGGFIAMQKGSQCVRIGVGDQKFFEAQGYVKVMSCAAAPTATLPRGAAPTLGARPTLPPGPGVRPGLPPSPLVGEDSDGDGLIDSWERNFFGSLQQGIDDDYDEDGFSNGEEYSLNADPTDASSPGKKGGGLLWIILGVVVIGGAIFLVIWLKRKRRKIKEAPEKKAEKEDDFLSLIKKSTEGKADGKKEVFLEKETSGKEKGKKIGEEGGEINPKVRDYVEKARKAGYDSETIKNNLLQVGWDRKQIEAALKR